MRFRQLRIDDGKLTTRNDFVIQSKARNQFPVILNRVKNLKALVEVGGEFE